MGKGTTHDQQINDPTRTLRRRRGQHMTPQERQEAQTRFLESFKLNANITVACKAAQVDRLTFYKWQEHDTQFALEYQQAELAANDMLLAAAWQRAVKGVEEPVVSMGKQVYVDNKPLMKRIYSDPVLLRLMSWRLPGFSEKQQVDLTTHASAKDMQAIQEAITQALSSYPEAKVALADALATMERERGK